MPQISIIIPMYKVEQYLRQCLDSVLNQTFSDYECILVDDGSPDNCPAICDEYAEKDRRFKVIHKENGGLSDARNVGIQAASGEYIVLLDSDDMFADINALENLYRTIENTKAEVIFNSSLALFTNKNDFVYYNGFHHDSKQYSPIQFYKKARNDSNMLLTAWRFVVRHDFLLYYNLFFKQGILHEDEEWFPRVIACAKIVAINRSVFYAYRKGRSGSIISELNHKRLDDVISIIHEFREIARGSIYPVKSRKIFEYHAAQLWRGVYLQLPLYRHIDEKQFNQIIDCLDKTKIILFSGRNIKYVIFGIIVLLFGVKKLIAL